VKHDCISRVLENHALEQGDSEVWHQREEGQDSDEDPKESGAPHAEELVVELRLEDN